MFALTVEQQLVVDIRQQELDTPALNAQLILHQHDRTAVVASLWTRDHADLVTEEADMSMRTEGGFYLRHSDSSSGFLSLE